MEQGQWGDFSGSPAWLGTALGELGTREIAGAGSNKRIDEYAKATRGGVPPSGDETAWCSPFANWVLLQNGIVGTRTKRARDWLTWGDPTELRHAAITVLSRGSDDNSGHVAFLLHWDKSWLWLLGGNQGNAVSIARYPRPRLLGCRFPLKSVP